MICDRCLKVYRTFVFLGVAAIVSYFYQYFWFKNSGIKLDNEVTFLPYGIASAIFFFIAFLINLKIKKQQQDSEEE